MEINQPTNFDEVFLDVRRAYRLLYLYQRRVMDLMKFIGDRLALRYAGGWPKFSSAAPRAGKGSLDNWAWDWLNMYLYEFHFTPKTIDNCSIQFSVFLVSDTAYFDASLESECDVKAYPPAETGDTRIVFLTGKDAWIGDLPDFWEMFKKETTDVIRSTAKGTIVSRSLPLKQFVNGDSADLAIQGFTDLCAANGIPEMKPDSIK